MEWLTYIAELIRYGRYVMPFDADSRFAPIAGRDIALTAATILAKPEEHGGRTDTLTGPVVVQPPGTGRRGQPRPREGPPVRTSHRNDVPGSDWHT